MRHHGNLEFVYNPDTSPTTNLCLSIYLSSLFPFYLSPTLTYTMSAPKTSRAWVLANPPTDMPDENTFKLVEQNLDELKDGEVLVKTTYLCNDPAQRGWIEKDVIA